MNILIAKEFSWDIKKAVAHYYRVQCACQLPEPPAGGPNDATCGIPGNCPSVAIITIAATDINDLCKKLGQQGVACNQIQRIDKHIEPVNQKQSGCTSPVTLPPADDCQDCCDFINTNPSSSSSSGFSSSHASSNFGPLPPFPSTTLIEQVAAKKPRHFTDAVFDIITLNERVVNPEPIQVPVAPLPQTFQNVQVDCCDALLPLAFEFRHNLNTIQPLAAFLRTNGFTLVGTIRSDSFIKLNYNVQNSNWQGSLHYNGQSPTGSYSESWDILCQFGCSDQNLWRFSLLITGISAARRASARLLAFFDTSVVCPKSDVFFGFNFNLNKLSLQANPATSQPIILHDEFGFFRKSQESPLLRFQLLPQQNVGSDQVLVDLSAQYDATLFVPAEV